MPIKSFRRADVSMEDVTGAPDSDLSFLPGATCSIGRKWYHDIVLNSPHISDDHAVIYNHAQHGLLVIDLYTEAGTFVAGERLPILRPLPLRNLSDLAIPIYGVSTGEAEVTELVKRVAEVLRTKTDFPNALGNLFVSPHPFAYDPSSTFTSPSAMQWRPVPTPTKSTSAPPTELPTCAPEFVPGPPPDPSTPPRSTRRFSPLPTRARTTRVSGAPPMPLRHASPGRIFNHPSPKARVGSPLANQQPSPRRTTRASPAAVPRASPLRASPAPAPRAGRAYPEIPREFTRETPREPLVRTQASTPNVPRTPHPQDADIMPRHSPCPRPILKTKSKRVNEGDESSRPRKRARMDADELVRGMPGAWPYEASGGKKGLKEESLKERVEKEMGGRRRVRFGEPGVWVGAEA